LAKRIHGLTNLPLYPLDNIWWKKDRTNITREEFERILDGILMEDSWIIDGDFKRTYEKRIAACDTIIFLDYDEEVCLQGITERVGQERDDMPWTENEIDPELVTLVKQYTNNSKPVLLELFKKYSDKNVIIFHTRKEANEYFGFKED
jgi:adenylate kinase family enzyme